MTRRGDATSALLRAVLGSFEGFRAEVEEIRSRSWASATFSGTRHEMRVRIEGAGADIAADRFIAGLADAEFELRGHILADIALVSDERRAETVTVSLEALTVEED